MFIEKLSKNQLNIIGVLSISIATIFLVLVIVIPIFLKRQMTNNYIQKCNPTINNTKLWASFPGELDSNLSHHFSFFNYQRNGEEYKINLHKNISIKEEVNYTNFTKDENNIYFLNNRSYQYLNEQNSENENENNINSINLGMFEALETLSHPPLYKIGINAIYYLLKKLLIEPDIFIRELYTYHLSKSLSGEDIIEKILINVEEEKIDRIFDNSDEKYKKYSLNTSSGFYEWIKILGSKEKISNALWLSNLFLLTEEEILSILFNEDAYLIKEYKNFNKYLAQKFNCDGEQCDIKLLYLQLINSSVISELFPELNNFEKLNSLLKTNYYPFDKSPEMKIFYDEVYSKQKEHKEDFEDVKPNLEQINKLLDLNSEYCLLTIENSISFLYINKTEYKPPIKQEKNKEYFGDLTYEQINYLTEYFYDYLPKIFFNHQINKEKENNNLNIEDSISYDLISKTIANFIPLIAEKTYKNLNNLDLFSLLLKKLILLRLKEKLNAMELDEICPIIMQNILDDGKKVLAICSDPTINLTNIESVTKYINYFFCLPEYEQYNSTCDNSLIDYFKQKVYLTKEEIDKIISENSTIYEVFESSFYSILQTYNCSQKCDNDYFTKMQFLNSWVTRNVPEPIPKSNSTKEIFPEIKEEYEILAIKEKYHNNDIYNEQDAMLIIDLMNIKGDEIYNLDNADIFYRKIKMEKEFSNAIYQGKESALFNLYYLLINLFIFDNKDMYNFMDINDDNSKSSLIVNYSSINNFLEGKTEENQYWINIIKEGNYFENFKPNLDSVTKFDFGFNFDTKEQEKIDLYYMGIDTRNSDYNKRRYTKMNNLLTLNIKKEEYDYILNKTIYTAFPLYNFEKLLDIRKFSDGFQYDNSLEVIYYYDLISTRPLRFIRDENENYQQKIECKKYILDPKSLSAGINEYFDNNDDDNPFLIQKVNKPFMITNKIDVLKEYGYDDLKEEDIINYICIDPISDMVIDSKMNLIYTLNTRKYNLINKKIKSNTNFPLFLYQRNYEINVNSYENLFPGVTEYYQNATTFIVVGIIIIILFAAIGLVSFIYLNKKLKEGSLDEIKNGELKPIEEILTSKIEDGNEQGKKND